MKIGMLPRRLFTPVFHIDTNLINARQALDQVNRLERWHRDEVILINMSSVSRDEARANANPERTRKADQYIFTIADESESEDELFPVVAAAIFPGGAKEENQRNDVRIICEAAKYAAILVTRDGGSRSQPGGILGSREKLSDFVQIMSPDEAVAFVRAKIEDRDQFNRRVAREIGGELPSWTGQD